MTSGNSRRVLTGAGLGLAVSAAAAVFLLERPVTLPASAAGEQTATPAIPVTVAEVRSRAITVWQEFSGRLEAIDRVQVRSRVAGVIQSVDFREGSLVKADDLLFTIDPAPYEAAVAEREGQVASARAHLRLAKLELDRGNKLIGTQAISQSTLDQRRNAYAEALANLQTAEAALTSAKLELDYTHIKAPVGGRVGRIEITAGNLVSAGASSPALTTLVSIDPIYASFNVSEDAVAKALRDLPASDGALPPIEQIPVEIGTSADEGTPIKGKLQLIDNQVDAASGTIGVRAVFDNPDRRLIPGQFVRIRMGEPNPLEKILVSERAVGTDQDKKFVYVVDGENKVSYRPVELGRSAEGKQIVESGLNSGERIVVNGLQRIRDGAVVDPQPEGKVAAAR
ncbi:multidrug efflux system membrane fusion protein [Breoghania corrubedonensis]|uniref:Multidrug efflux system membrane fusion protein n=1 Tax=Breoghania corrubedonensis TaxID=665038 RepID=A0A2T5V6C4_9HYPH|nr:efflux RND transporter periplasmic adaptor subunit [Breoghania corrubedonensis]PTW59307.1 multidrug efflux system membrane fusion protein [Breoghania corrubedonensis]